MTEIHWDDLVNQKSLTDGDKIAVQEHAASIPPSQIEIILKLGPGITWWKGLQASEIVLCQCQDSQSYSLTRINVDDITNKQFTFWKAKFLGAHEAIYTLSDEEARQHLKGGNSYLFEWLAN